MSTVQLAPARRPDRDPAGHDSRPRRLRRRRVRRRQGARRPGLRARRAVDLPRSAASIRRASRRGPSTPSRCSRSASSRCSGSISLQRIQGVLPLDPTDADGSASRPRVQHGGHLRHQHELAELRRRADDEPPHPDGRPHGAELRLGRGRAGRRGGADPRVRAPPLGDDRQLLGRPHARHDPRAAAARDRDRDRAREPGRRPEPPRLHRTRRRCRASPSRSPAARSRARRRSRSSARTAAAPTTPTRPTRSRTRTASRTCSRSSSS